MKSYLQCQGGSRGNSTMVSRRVSNLHEDAEVCHHALRQAILIKRDAFWHEWNRWKLAGVVWWTLQKVGVKLRLDLSEDVLERIVREVEKLNRAAAVRRHSAGVVVA